MGVWNGITWVWEFKWRKHILFEWEKKQLEDLKAQQKIKQIDPNIDDKCLWNGETFSLKSFLAKSQQFVF